MQLFHAPTIRIHDWIKQQPNVKEESLTDWMLYDLSRRCSRLRYYALTRYEESLIGADWEWWILARHYAYRFRVQAKKLKSKADNYSSIAYSNKKGMQIELLLQAAKDDGAFPIYMFYSAEEQSTDTVSLQYPNPLLKKMIAWCSSCCTGAFLSPAQSIYSEVLDKPRQLLKASALLNISLKLSCFDWLLKSNDPQDINDGVEESLAALHTFYLQEEPSCPEFRYRYFKPNYRGSNNYIRESYDPEENYVPEWVSFLSNDEKMRASLEVPDWFESEFRKWLPRVAGVAILDIRHGLTGCASNCRDE